MSIHHFTAAALWPLKPFAQRDICAYAWNRLRARFPRVLACVLMPNHLHFIADGFCASELARIMATEMAAITRRVSPGKKLWQPAPPPIAVPDLLHLKRQIRYTHLNPCRAGLAGDPLQWEWSTHRDAVGAAAPSWLDIATLKSIWKGRDFAAQFHAYVSGDPDVRIEGTSLPWLTPPPELAAPLARIEWAVTQATRAPEGSRLKDTPARRLMLLAARRIGNSRYRDIAQWINRSERTAKEILSLAPTQSEEEALRSVYLLLSNPGRFEVDPRLQKGAVNR
jgi:hypothetical protein